jgi:hypothetical protein
MKNKKRIKSSTTTGEQLMNQEERNWRILAHSGAITGHKCRFIKSQRIYDILMGLFIGFVSGILTASFIDTTMRVILK